MRWFNTLTALFPVLVVSGGALLLMLFEAALGRPAEPAAGDVEGQYRTRVRAALRSAFAVGVLALAAAGSLGLWLLARRAGQVNPGLLSQIVERTAGLGGDRFAFVVYAILCAGGILVLLQAGSYLRELGMDRPEFPLLVLFAVLGGMFLAAARDLLLMFIGLETLSLGTYCLVAFQRSSLKSTEAALKYFLLGSFAAAILLFGMALLYGVTGSLELSRIGKVLSLASPTAFEPVAAIGMSLVVVGLAFKVSAVPFHMWTPDAYEGAPTPTTAFMAVVVKTAAFAVMMRVLLVAFPLGSPLSSAPAGWVSLLTGFALLTMVLGNFAGLMQDNVKRLLAYSSIAHAGYILIGVIVAGAVRSTVPRHAERLQADAVGAVLFYLVAYTLATAGAFAVLSICARDHREPTKVADLHGLAVRSPGLAAGFLVCVLSLVGIPPTAGFFGKLYLFKLAVQADLWPLALVGVLTSVAAAYYYLRLVVAVYMRPAETEDVAVAAPTARGRLGIAAAALLVVTLGLLPARVLSVATQSVFDLLRM
ncbi:MAG: NADH-quinone oxidoreductase subunit N [Deltaproteobacteria bacterium]|nr:NADH-quinone oxidoreductase subunit N [Deltaproteobacteria bacterium]